MARYIDADALMKWLCGYGKMDEFFVGYLESVIEAQPTVDAVDVVRCKDCVHRHQTTCPFLIANAYKASSDDDFCSRGERREDATD